MPYIRGLPHSSPLCLWINTVKGRQRLDGGTPAGPLMEPYLTSLSTAMAATAENTVGSDDKPVLMAAGQWSTQTSGYGGRAGLIEG